jgi:hypothetical protein
MLRIRILHYVRLLNYILGTFCSCSNNALDLGCVEVGYDYMHAFILCKAGPVASPTEI